MGRTNTGSEPLMPPPLFFPLAPKGVLSCYVYVIAETIVTKEQQSSD